MDIAYNRDNTFLTFIKWSVWGLCACLCLIGLQSLHRYQSDKIITGYMDVQKKSFLVTQMHKEMLSITSTQLQILHASNEEEVKVLLWDLSAQVSNYLFHYHELEGIVDNSDRHLLTQFKTGFEQWHSFNKNILSYANVVADSGFISTLNMIDLAFSQIDTNTDESLLLIAKLQQSVKAQQTVSN